METSKLTTAVEPFLNSMKGLQDETDFYTFEKKFEEEWIKAGRVLMQEIIGPAGNDRRVKKKRPRDLEK